MTHEIQKRRIAKFLNENIGEHKYRTVDCGKWYGFVREGHRYGRVIEIWWMDGEDPDIILRSKEEAEIYSLGIEYEVEEVEDRYNGTVYLKEEVEQDDGK